MVAIPHDFTPTVPDVLPPCCLEAEESVLGGVMLDPGAIDRIKFRLKPEHFYLPSHKLIYEACLKLSKKNQPTELLTLTSYLSDHHQLDKIGGKTKLVSLLERCVSTANIDHLAGLICQKALRRGLIELGNSTMQLGYSNEMEIDEILGIVRKKTERLTGLELIQTEDENRLSRFNHLIDKLKNVYTKIVEPDYRLYCLQELACEVSKSTRFLEDLYARHLVKKVVSPLMTYEELKEVARSSTKEWLHQGLFPKRTTGVLYGSGGILKTKLLYQVCKSLIQGKNLGEFSATGQKRKIMIYQGDERESDMASALEIMGYDEGDIGQYIKIRFNWSFEHMPLLIQDLKDFQPDFVIIDSLTFSSRFSSYNENEVAYARPILELTGLANEHNTSFMLVHHANRNGDIRGSSAIFNAVSEVWKIEKDISQFATPNDRLLTVEKSRSRSSGKKYRVIFEPDNLDFVFLGEQDKDNLENQTDVNCRASILEYLRNSPNVPYTCEELVHYVKYSRSFTAKALSLLVCDGLVNCKRGRGSRASTFYLAYEGAIPLSTQFAAPTEGVRGETLEQQIGAANIYTQHGLQDCCSSAPTETKTFFENSPPEHEKRGAEEQQMLKAIPSIDKFAAPTLNTKEEQLNQQEQQIYAPNVCYNPPENPEDIAPIQQSLIPEIPTRTKSEPLQKIQAKHVTCFGEVKAIAQQIDSKMWQFTITPTGEGFRAIMVEEKIGKSKPETRIKHHIDEWLRSKNFQVYKTDVAPAQWVDNCKWVESGEHYEPMRKTHTFVDVDGKFIKVSGHGCDRIRVMRH
ncbi:DnaB-like helicase N-terminal domain-containing protein [Brunnivagina elsteri]|uniref:DNA helicase DnaB-like N-terminal domain-containing protein n=1 Tax=Brunnivagina elsteri CCALA 953 TaxID=987040 RepID=A0A2A2TE83_9CYAN|nr:DnaB-like helicase N-terminal domain-containing protein [Calothrix elsteri]PAX52064.1 hypothetical protein CK510_21395 [Calothrix elsteri CCALA 953]